MSWKDKKWSDLKGWQKITFFLSLCLMLFGLIYLPIEYATKKDIITLVDGMSGCTFNFYKYNFTSIDCPGEVGYMLANISGELTEMYTFDDYVERYNNYMKEQNKVKGFGLSTEGFNLNIS